MTLTDIDTAFDALSMSEFDPDPDYGAGPFDDRYARPTAGRAVDAAALAEVPQAFLAYIDCQQNQWS